MEQQKKKRGIHQKYLIKCKTCTKEILVWRYALTKNHFCSRGCYYQSKRGKPSWSKGKKLDLLRYPHYGHRKPHTERTKEIISEKTKLAWKEGRLKPRKMSPEARKKISLAHLGKSYLKGRKFPERSGPKSNLWRGGISKQGYPTEFNRELKLKIRVRDNFTCQKCGKSEKQELEERKSVLCVNHIDANKLNCDENNLNALCHRCNVQVAHKARYWAEYFQQFQTCLL